MAFLFLVHSARMYINKSFHLLSISTVFGSWPNDLRSTVRHCTSLCILKRTSQSVFRNLNILFGVSDERPAVIVWFYLLP